MKKIGIVTIGQSPRPDVVEEMAPFFGKKVNEYVFQLLRNNNCVLMTQNTFCDHFAILGQTVWDISQGFISMGGRFNE